MFCSPVLARLVVLDYDEIATILPGLPISELSSLKDRSVVMSFGWPAGDIVSAIRLPLMLVP